MTKSQFKSLPIDTQNVIILLWRVQDNLEAEAAGSTDDATTLSLRRYRAMIEKLIQHLGKGN